MNPLLFPGQLFLLFCSKFAPLLQEKEQSHGDHPQTRPLSVGSQNPQKGYPNQFKTFERKADAETWAREIESEMERSVFVSRKEAESTFFDEALERFKDEFVPGYSSPKRMKSRIKILQKHDLSKMTLASIRGKDIAEYVKDREDEGRASQTILHEVNLISRIFEVARKDWGMESLGNPTKNVNKPKQGKGRTRRLEKGEEKKLLENTPKELKPIILLLWKRPCAGAR